LPSGRSSRFILNVQGFYPECSELALQSHLPDVIVKEGPAAEILFCWEQVQTREFLAMVL
jgi:hypothetical protein